MTLLVFLGLLVFVWFRSRDAERRDAIRRLEARVQRLEAHYAEPATPRPIAADIPVVAPPEPPPLEPLPIEPSAAPPPPPPPWRPEIDWERLFGVRAAAVLGGIALALAGLLFFKYSIEHGLIPPWVRVVTGLLVGTACLVGSERSWRSRYIGTANALAGGGIAILYAASWAAGPRYQLVGLGPAFVAMAMVTIACCVLAWRHISLVVALIGLVGGFVTPLLLSSGVDRPLGLFGYILLLDMALLALGRLRGWSLLAPLSLVATVLYQALWVFVRMGDGWGWFALAMLAGFGTLYAVLLRPTAAPVDRTQRWTAAAAILLPFAFAIHLATRAALGPHLLPLGAFMALLAGAGCWVGQVHRVRLLSLGVAGAVLGVTLSWTATRWLTPGQAWELALVAIAIAGVMHVAEVEARTDGATDPGDGALAAAGGFVLLLMAAAERTMGTTPWPWVVGTVGLTGLVVRQGGRVPRQHLHLVAAALVGSALGLLLHRQDGLPDAPPAMVYHALFLAVAVWFQVIALQRRNPITRRAAEHAAGLVAVVLLAATAPWLRMIGNPALVLVVISLLGGLIALVAARTPSGLWMAAAVLATAAGHLAWTAAVSSPQPWGVLLQAATVVILTAWPFVFPDAFRVERFAWYAAAATGPLWLWPARQLVERTAGDGYAGLVAIALALPATLATQRVRQLDARFDTLRTGVLAWYAAAALGLVAAAIPLQVEKEWITIGWAVEAFAIAYLWTRIDYPGLKYLALGLAGAAVVRLIGNPAVLGYYPRPAWRIVNWLAYTYLVPAAALFGVAACLHPREVARAVPNERDVLFGYAHPYGSMVTGLAGLIVVFVWINLSIADWFSTGPMLEVSFERLPARDLATSVCWALYAVGLLAIGMFQRSTALRWVSLVFLLVTIGKVFLYDLGELRDLYRVASLFGLAMSLLGVSVAYQRFVFRSDSAEEQP